MPLRPRNRVQRRHQIKRPEDQMNPPQKRGRDAEQERVTPMRLVYPPD